MSSRGLPPQIRMLVAILAAATRLGLAPAGMDVVRQPAAQRQLANTARWMTRPPSPGVRTREVTIASRGGELRLRIYEGPGCRADGPAMLYIHGGAFILGGLNGAHWLCSELALETGMLVASVEYRLAPEDPHPAALDDCYDALAWLAASGVDADHLAVAGDSAGGNLAAALTLRVRADGGPRVAHQTLIYPVLDTRISSDSWRRWGRGGMSIESGRMMIKLWLGEHPQDDPLVAPLLADDLSRLPPAHVVLAECDVLYDDGAAYAARLLEAGVPTRLSIYDRMPHGFLSVNRLCPPARPAVRTIAREVSRAFAVSARL
jgi:acetyl esterase